MRLSKYFLPIIKETPKEAEIISHQLMLRAGLIQQSSSGIYSWLPLGLRVLKKIEKIIREEMDEAGAQELLMPTLQSADLWRESGRYDVYGKEMLRINDRHEHEMLYGPTNEEVVTDIFRRSVRSYKDLPKNLYHLQWKFRDETRPRFGVMRGREFLMKDAYSFDIDEAGAIISYYQMFRTYMKIFRRMGLTPIPVKADTGAIGGNLSHEFHIQAETGESQLYFDSDIETKNELLLSRRENKDFFYSAADDKHDPAEFQRRVSVERQKVTRGIEVGQLFYFGTKYSESMGAFVTGADGSQIPVEMGSYGIGVSRLIGAIIESSRGHDKDGIIWPESVAPFLVGILNLKTTNAECTKVSDMLYEQLRAGGTALYDDRNISAGIKFAEMDMIGLPWQLIISPRGIAAGTIEVKERATGNRQHIKIKSVNESMNLTYSMELHQFLCHVDRKFHWVDAISSSEPPSIVASEGPAPKTFSEFVTWQKRRK